MQRMGKFCDKEADGFKLVLNLCPESRPICSAPPCQRRLSVRLTQSLLVVEARPYCSVVSVAPPQQRLFAQNRSSNSFTIIKGEEKLCNLKLKVLDYLLSMFLFIFYTSNIQIMPQIYNKCHFKIGLSRKN
jgi:hypothetical protein